MSRNGAQIGRKPPLQDELITLKMSECKAFLQIQIEAGQPVFLWGDPGVGKTEVIRRVSVASGRKYFETRLLGRDVVDLYGMPKNIGDDQSGYRRPAFIPPADAGKCVWFIDEVNRNNMQMLNVALQPVRDKVIGEHQLPSEMVTLVAGNYEDDPGVIRTSSAFNLRFKHVCVIPDLDDWCEWAAQNEIEPAVIAFLRLHPEMLHLFDPKLKSSANPRTWAMFSESLTVALRLQVTERLIEADVVGSVGSAVGRQFMTFFQIYMANIRPDDILKNPTTARIPDNPSILYAVCGALAYHSGDPVKFSAIRKYAERLPSEFDTLLMHMAVGKHGKKVTATPQYTAWAAKRPDLFTNSSINWSFAA